MSEEPNETQASVRPRRRWSSVWIIPFVALALASWLVWKNYADKGPLVLVTFETADSLKAGTTEVRCRSVKVGAVESVKLAGDLGSVDIQLRINPTSEDLLHKDTRFWVVRPRVSTRNISGLGTLLSGAYIELDPGEAPEDSRSFIGLEQPPVTSSSIPGLRITLFAQKSGSLDVGSPIYFRGFEVGQVERRTFDVKNQGLKFDVFIEKEYASLVTSNTRFWNTSGIQIGGGADGFKLSTPSLLAMLAGGVSFAILDDQVSGSPATNGSAFTLFPDEESAHGASFHLDQTALLFFDQTVRGLKRGAPVEFRGIALGRVTDITFQYSVPGDPRIPVLIKLDTSSLSQDPKGELDPTTRISDAVRRGLYAKLSTGSLLTGALYVELDFATDIDPAAAPSEITFIDKHLIIPTRSSGLAQMEGKLNAILSTIEALPLNDTLTKFGTLVEESSTTIAQARSTLDEVDATLADFRQLIANDATQSIPEELNATLTELRSSIESLGPGGNVQGDLRRTLDEMRSALRSIQTLSSTIEEKPNSLFFGRKSGGDPIPKAQPAR